MKNEAQRYLKHIFLLWLVFVVAMANADALVLGEIKVLSHLGQPLRALVEFVELSDAEASQLEVRLAGLDEYQKLDLQYPYGHRFSVHLLKLPGTQPVVSVNSTLPMDELFVNLLLEFSSSGSKFSKTYSLLLDPASDFPNEATSADTKVTEHQIVAADAGEMTTKRVKPVKRVYQPRRVQTENAAMPRVQESNSRSHLKLAMSLSISRYDPAINMNPKENVDVLQEELISKEKMLEDLKVQINAMQGLIKTLQIGQEHLPNSSGVLVASGVVQETAQASVPTVKIKANSNTVGKIEGLNGALLLIAGVLMALVFVGYRKYRQAHAWQQNPFDNLDETSHPVDVPTFKIHQPVLKADAPLTIEKPVFSLGDQTMETLAYLSQKNDALVPPEYSILLKANKFLRSGEYEAAERALLEVIKINPGNSYGNLALLRLYAARQDAAQFEKLARQFKAVGDVDSFKEAAEMGRQLDPDNPLYG